MDYAKKLAKLTEDVGETAVQELVNALEAQEDRSDESWEKALVGLAADGIEKFGPEGVQKASEALETLLTGKGDLKISEVTQDMLVASDLLAALQSAEADRKQKARAWLRLVGEVAAKLTKGFIKGLL